MFVSFSILSIMLNTNWTPWILVRSQSIWLASRLNQYNRNRYLQTCKAPLESQAQGTSLFRSAVIDDLSVDRLTN